MKNPKPVEIERILAIRREAGLQIDPATAEVTRGLIDEIYYGVEDPPKEVSYLDFEYFARTPGSDIWVAFQDLPADTRETLSARQRARDLEVEQFIAIRREAGLHIDPATAEFDWFYAEVLDPYGVEGVPDGFSCVGREYFARAPGSDIWVSFQDLPKETQLALFPKIKPSFSG